MLDIKRTAIALDEKELLELERIVTDSDANEALGFLRKALVYVPTIIILGTIVGWVGGFILD